MKVRWTHRPQLASLVGIATLQPHRRQPESETGLSRSTRCLWGGRGLWFSEGESGWKGLWYGELLKATCGQNRRTRVLTDASERKTYIVAKRVLRYGQRKYDPCRKLPHCKAKLTLLVVKILLPDLQQCFRFEDSSKIIHCSGGHNWKCLSWHVLTTTAKLHISVNSSASVPCDLIRAFRYPQHSSS